MEKDVLVIESGVFLPLPFSVLRSHLLSAHFVFLMKN